MRVAIACDGANVSPHFGRCERFLLAEVAGGSVEMTGVFVNPDHEPGMLPQLIKDQGVECVLAGGAGPRAVSLLAEVGVRFIGGVSGEPAEVLLALAHGTLEPGESACDH